MWVRMADNATLCGENKIVQLVFCLPSLHGLPVWLALFLVARAQSCDTQSISKQKAQKTFKSICVKLREVGHNTLSERISVVTLSPLMTETLQISCTSIPTAISPAGAHHVDRGGLASAIGSKQTAQQRWWWGAVHQIR
jgi:hypothetical protein